jgi:hypothetical protein
MQRRTEAVVAPEHQPVKAGRVDAAHRVARDDLTGGDVGGGIDLELQRDRQFGEVDGELLLQWHRDLARWGDSQGPVVVFENVRGNRLGSAGKCLRIRLSCLRNDRLTDFTTLTLSNRAPALETGMPILGYDEGLVIQ